MNLNIARGRRSEKARGLSALKKALVTVGSMSFGGLVLLSPCQVFTLSIKRGPVSVSIGILVASSQAFVYEFASTTIADVIIIELFTRVACFVRSKNGRLGIAEKSQFIFFSVLIFEHRQNRGRTPWLA